MGYMDSSVLTWGTVKTSDATYWLLRDLEDHFRNEASGGATMLGTAISAVTAASGIFGLIIPTVFSVFFSNDARAEKCERLCDYMVRNNLSTLSGLKLQLDITYHSVTREIKDVRVLDIDHPAL